MRKTLTVAVAALAIGLAGCTASQDNSNTQKYPAEAKDNFVDTCTSTSLDARPGDEKAARKNCRCIVDSLEENGLPYDRKNAGEASFKDADVAIKDGKAVPNNVQDDFDKATADCRK